MPRVLSAQSAHGETLAAELFTGVAFSLRTPLVVDLAGERHVIRAHWSTRPFEDAPYYSYRVARASVGRELAAEMLHHKLYLENPVPPIDRLEVSHGYNEPMFDVATRAEGFHWRFGIGLVIAHPEGAIAGREVGPLRTRLARGSLLVPNVALHALGGLGVQRRW